MIEALRSLYHRVKAVLIGALVEADKEIQAPEVAEIPSLAAEPALSKVPAQVQDSLAEVQASPAEASGMDKWTVTPYHDPPFEKIGRVYLVNGDLVIRSDRDPRGFVLLEGDLDQVLSGGTGTVRLLDLTGTVRTARFSSSGLAMNIVIDQQLHMVPMRSLTLVLSRNRRGPLFVPSEVMEPDPLG